MWGYAKRWRWEACWETSCFSLWMMHEASAINLNAIKMPGFSISAELSDSGCFLCYYTEGNRGPGYFKAKKKKHSDLSSQTTYLFSCLGRTDVWLIKCILKRGGWNVRARKKFYMFNSAKMKFERVCAHKSSRAYSFYVMCRGFEICIMLQQYRKKEGRASTLRLLDPKTYLLL